MEGTGLMVVAAVGKNSYYGKLKMKIQAADDTTPLQEKLTVLADQVGVVGMWSAGATFISMFVHYLYDCTQSNSFVSSLRNDARLLLVLSLNLRSNPDEYFNATGLFMIFAILSIHLKFIIILSHSFIY